MSVEPWMLAVAAHGHDAAAGPADVAQQQLEDAGGADDLHAGRVLRPADGVDDGAGALAARSCRRAARRRATICSGVQPQICDDHLRRVAGEVLAQELHDAARVLQRRVARRLPARLVRSAAAAASRVAGRAAHRGRSPWMPCAALRSCLPVPAPCSPAASRVCFDSPRELLVAPVALGSASYCSFSGS